MCRICRNKKYFLKDKMSSCNCSKDKATKNNLAKYCDKCYSDFTGCEAACNLQYHNCMQKQGQGQGQGCSTSLTSCLQGCSTQKSSCLSKNRCSSR